MNGCYRAMVAFCFPSYCSSIQLEVVFFGNDDIIQNSQTDLADWCFCLLTAVCLLASPECEVTLLPLPDLFSPSSFYFPLHQSKSLHLTEHLISYLTLSYCPYPHPEVSQQAPSPLQAQGKMPPPVKSAYAGGWSEATKRK